MIKEILSSESCSECRGCCIFAESEVWEVPHVVSTVKRANGGETCAYLKEYGCELSEDKPIECAMYPFRIMDFFGKRVLAVSGYCKAVSDLSLSEILRFAEGKSSDFTKAAESDPKIVKKYSNEYVILKVL